MEFPIVLHARFRYNTSGVSTSYCTITEIKDGRVIGTHMPCALRKIPGAPFNVKLHETPDGKGMFCTGSDSGKRRWYFADIGKKPGKWAIY